MTTRYNEMKLEEGLNIIETTPTGYGDLHVYVRDGNVTNVTIFNASIKKKKTHTVKHNDGGKPSHWVNLDVKVDED
tara:strand:- start:1714 stop:1941 length:228 start_codon:yes stop_codon:yes gene_type:complete